MATAATTVTRSRSRGRSQWLMGYAFIAPLLAFFLVYHLYPIGRALWLSFTNFKYLAQANTRFVGLDNYAEALSDKYVWHGVVLALEYLVMYVPLSLGLALVVAIVLDRVSSQRAAGVYRTVYYLPVVLPSVVVYVLWKWMYQPSIGLVNYFLVDTFHLFASRPTWLYGTEFALPSIAIMESWRFLGYNVLLLLVGLSSINRDLYEAARMDGASELQVVRHITLPLLKPTFLVLMVLKMRIFSILEPMLVAPGPSDSTWTWGWYAYNLAFVDGTLRMGYASAVGHLGALIMCVFVYMQYRVFRHERA
jgi:multiple sugar transport system permease protein